VGERVKKFYPKIKPDSVIYPPVNLRQSSVITPPAVGLVNYLLVISRLVSHKKIELAIKACDRLGKNLIIVGRGPAKAELLRLAEAQKNTVLFLDQVNQTQLANLYQHCQALLMPGEEDFGIVALEANLFGKPVLINARSGAAELIEPKVHGFHIESETVEAVVLAIEKLATHQFSASQIKRNPLQYGTNTFVKNFARAVDRHWQKVKKDNL
jgi:glycosyltransferase involved in cell wall biosynthesis